MELGTSLRNEIHKLAENQGFKHGQYKIDVVNIHEFLYKGVDTRVTITSQRGECVYLKIKQRPTISADFKIPWANCFFNNVHFYTNVLPILKTYGNVPMSPKYYGSSLKNGEEFLILEDLEKSENYKILGPFPGLSEGHVKEAIKMMAYFHCTVKLWKTKNPQQFKSISGQFKPVLSSKYSFKTENSKSEKILKEMLTAVWHLLRNQGGDMYPIFQKLMPNIRKLVNYALSSGKDVEDQEWTTLANCYTYTSNLLFKCHTGTGAVIDVGLEDWSAARLGSPALDLCLLLLSTPSTDLYREMPSLVSEYFNESLTVVELKEKHIPRYGIFGLFAAIFITIAKSIEDQVDMKLDSFTVKTLDESFTSTTIPDVKERLVEMMKAAIAIKVI